MSDTDPQLTRVRLEYDDGTAQELTGDAAQGWLSIVNGAIGYAGVHGYKLPDFPWQTTTSVDAERTRSRQLYEALADVCRAMGTSYISWTALGDDAALGLSVRADLHEARESLRRASTLLDGAADAPGSEVAR